MSMLKLLLSKGGMFVSVYMQNKKKLECICMSVEIQ